MRLNYHTGFYPYIPVKDLKKAVNDVGNRIDNILNTKNKYPEGTAIEYRSKKGVVSEGKVIGYENNDIFIGNISSYFKKIKVLRN